ncbi:high affinity copper uptake protein 1 isoform X2 [Hyalella azteca]|uniref:Copper transport protein n=1 Tax=Hyalella azteca TaxID=294128 RepID=A0A8B7NQW9_HYAAZ|nr:high affinity copper uptake protein 1 isoform X2 [Hyalella azteca]
MDMTNHHHHHHGSMKENSDMKMTTTTMDMGGMDMGGSTMDMGGMDMGGMMMYFHGGCNEVILFDFWRISEVWELLLSMLGIFILAFLYEALKYCREYLFRKAVQRVSYSTTSSNNITLTEDQQQQQPVSMKMMSSAHAIQTCLHMVQFLVSYLLMLVFMTYNAWLCLAVLLGAGVGYFVFGWRKALVVELTEHCH